MGIRNSHPYKTKSFESQEDFKETENFEDEKTRGFYFIKFRKNLR